MKKKKKADLPKDLFSIRNTGLRGRRPDSYPALTIIIALGKLSKLSESQVFYIK